MVLWFNNIIWDSMFPPGQSCSMLESQGLDSVRLARIRREEAAVQDSFELWKNVRDN